MRITVQNNILAEKDYIIKNSGASKGYYLRPDEYENYDEHTKQLLYDLICSMDYFPIFITYEAYDRDVESLLVKWGIHFTMIVSTPLNTYPLYHLHIPNSKSLMLVLNETFWTAASNQFYALSISGFIPLEQVKRHRRSVMLPSIDMAVHSEVMVIFHDGWGFEWYTNNPFTLPEGTIVTNAEE
ncbi:hypothetical protein GKZ89_07745 [Bacillus mangrovi]|uniref:Uncharacterized protein n=1 Tax=Metabacillus mangrovi TaxID=1491830 RepID=A0A7X2S4W1_9BACI|nr:hypothetical protein [Metabacillus mangrovi]MTH53305.1 hypothetical protein [Metabacillus mangrovi]